MVSTRAPGQVAMANVRKYFVRTGRAMVWVFPLVLVPTLEKEKWAIKSQPRELAADGGGGVKVWTGMGGKVGSGTMRLGGWRAEMPDQRLVVPRSAQLSEPLIPGKRRALAVGDADEGRMRVGSDGAGIGKTESGRRERKLRVNMTRRKGGFMQGNILILFTLWTNW